MSAPITAALEQLKRRREDALWATATHEPGHGICNHLARPGCVKVISLANHEVRRPKLYPLSYRREPR